MTKNEIITAFADLGIELTAKEKKQKKEVLMARLEQERAADSGSVDEKIRNAKIVKMPKPKALEDRVITEPAEDLKYVKAMNEGSKRHLLAQALERGATLDHLMAVVGWDRNTTASALRWDMGQVGLGVERKGEKYHLIMPKGLNALPIRAKDQTRKEALVAACK